MMAMIWFGLQAGDRELGAAMVVFAACCYSPMIVFGPPAYPVSWGHATLLLVIGCTVAGSLRALSRQVHIHTRRLQQEATVDDLTGLLNRRGWRQAGSQELARAARTGLPVVLAMLDLDGLKRLNDRAGHAAGDRLLAETGQRIRETLRAGDVVARVGGDELAALLSNSTVDGAIAVIQRLRECTPPDAPFSAGIASWDGQQSLQDLLHRADRALYKAKARGGTRTEVAPPEPVAGRHLAVAP
jgi:diguanylate cyclase (GGDEF)-like protein